MASKHRNMFVRTRSRRRRKSVLGRVCDKIVEAGAAVGCGRGGGGAGGGAGGGGSGRRLSRCYSLPARLVLKSSIMRQTSLSRLAGIVQNAKQKSGWHACIERAS
ncbi:hypothetical protein AAG570_009853 [Ranatra chinensis]|uniref:Uncharacterized protein n=1 Tax=Ranatra chinensis TaxID=642074 RepID=A0ABD0YQD9_9HEMI